MPIIDYIKEDQISEETSKILQEIKSQQGSVSKIYKVLGRNPKLLRALWDLRNAVMEHGKLDRKTKEMLALAVSITHNCNYCIHAHTLELKNLGVTQEEILEITGLVGLLSNFNTLYNGLDMKWE